MHIFIDRVKSLALAGFVGAFGGGFAISMAVAEETKQPEWGQVVVEDVDPSNYHDDRSTPLTLIAAYYNAINRREYPRAYSYHPGGSLDSLRKGYEKTKSIRLALRNNADPDRRGGGTLYWYQPVAIEVMYMDGKKEVFGGCYKLDQPNPAYWWRPPFISIGIVSGSLTKSSRTLEESVPESCDPA